MPPLLGVCLAFFRFPCEVGGHSVTLLAPAQATPKAIEAFPALPPSFFARPAEQVAPDLIGCLLVKRQSDGELLWGVIVETEAYCQSEPACHGHRRRSPSNETLFGEPGRFYVYLSYGIHHCVKRVASLPSIHLSSHSHSHSSHQSPLQTP